MNDFDNQANDNLLFGLVNNRRETLDLPIHTRLLEADQEDPHERLETAPHFYIPENSKQEELSLIDHKRHS